MISQTETIRTREVWVDWLRVAACFMVFIVHATELFYLEGQGSLILTETDAFWASFFDSFVRSCVPLFVIASSYLQFPLHYTTAEFLKKRAIRILIPFLFWTVVYALVWGEPVENFKNLLLNFNYAAGHLWFVYMILGIYLLMPILSPWAAKTSKKELLMYIGICFFTTLIPIIRDYASEGTCSVIYGPSGLPRQALLPLWGEASWNAYGTFYYFSGFIGYLFLGLYIRRFTEEISWEKTLGISIPCYLVGFAISFLGFLRRVYITADGSFPVEDLVDKAVWWETTWCNDTVGVALMAIAWIFIFKKIKAEGKFYKNILLPISEASYDIYLIHLLILVPICGLIRNWLGSGAEGSLGFWTTPVEIVLSAVMAFICTATISVILRQIVKLIRKSTR